MAVSKGRGYWLGRIDPLASTGSAVICSNERRDVLQLIWAFEGTSFSIGRETESTHAAIRTLRF
ncbi:hypothetical protein CY34DRAFT_713294 [Suillus luteus UH-Slu-Lm8-n1]|uniref:Uncharacterized protein n=1 Tax=Suillus luteus UH-Slu-Lm8-n1 TaxID=930992 RepID=A0A0D0AGN5_9AGAM|nr:hypothetical protein CY34DRAFT_713294 [Suillus luteus UH-Slu-Lm8-n1]